MAALQYVHVPGYAALILRKDTQRLRLAGGLIPRSHQWLAGGKARWNEKGQRWLLPTAGTPASVCFGYLATAQDKYRYGSSEFQYIAFDELTEFAEQDYLFLFSRLRRTRRIPVPLRMRSASNPGGIGHDWVKRRFISDDAVRSLAVESAATSPKIFYKNDIGFVPARIRDNPALDADEYGRSLMHLPVVIRQRLMNGDWSVMDERLIRQQWLRYYTASDRILTLRSSLDETLAGIDERNCRRFVTVDPAGTSAERARQQRGKAPSWTVAQVWDQPRSAALCQFLLLRHVARRRLGFDELCDLLRDVFARWRPQTILIENEKLGRAAYDVLRNELPIECIPTGGQDKATRAAPLIVKLQRGEIFLPQYNNEWLADLEAEWLSWTGLNDEATDQIDAAAYAVMYARRTTPGTIRIEPVFWQ